MDFLREYITKGDFIVSERIVSGSFSKLLGGCVSNLKNSSIINPQDFIYLSLKFSPSWKLSLKSLKRPFQNNSEEL
jgi:hypothetical protein